MDRGYKREVCAPMSCATKAENDVAQTALLAACSFSSKNAQLPPTCPKTAGRRYTVLLSEEYLK